MKQKCTLTDHLFLKKANLKFKTAVNFVLAALVNKKNSIRAVFFLFPVAKMTSTLHMFCTLLKEHILNRKMLLASLSSITKNLISLRG